MNRQDIILNNNIFVADYYTFDEMNIKHYDDYIMIRYFNYVNNIAVDKDVYFIEKNTFNEYIKDLYINDKKSSDIISFPITDSISGYSASYEDFNNMFSTSSLYEEFIVNSDSEDKGDVFVKEENGKKYYLNYGQDVYNIYDKNMNTAKIKCDKIKLYHPVSLADFNGIIHVYSYINTINFHFLCRKYNNYKTNSSTEFIKNNHTYSEYIELYVPNIDELFAEENDIYYNEDLNIIQEVNPENSTFIDRNVLNINDEDLIKLSLFTQPYLISKIIDNTNIKGDPIYAKTYMVKQSSVTNNYLSNIITLTLYSISDKINSDNNIYVYDSNLLYNTCTFIDNYSFSLSSKLGFNNGVISVINNIIYPKQNKFKTFADAYKYFNSVTEEDYKNFNGIDNIDDSILPEEVEEVTNVPLSFVGYKIELYSQLNYKSKFYANDIEFNNKDIDFNEFNNFNIKLNSIFSSWSEIPENIFVRVIFIDRYLGISLSSNLIIITKEWIKYMINDTNKYNLSLLNKANKEFINNLNMKTIDITDTSKINFLNNITCIVNKNEEKQNNIHISNTRSAKILYKPYFFKVQQLQNISLRENISQNIGINLSEYMTKVEAFKLIINNTEYLEIGRNDIFVIFNINAALINKASGKYDIFNQDDEYISTGQYNIY